MHLCGNDWICTTQTNVYEIRIANDAGSNGGRIFAVNHWIFLQNQLYSEETFRNYCAICFFPSFSYLNMCDNMRTQHFLVEFKISQLNVHTSLHFITTTHRLSCSFLVHEWISEFQNNLLTKVKCVFRFLFPELQTIFDYFTSMTHITKKLFTHKMTFIEIHKKKKFQLEHWNELQVEKSLTSSTSLKFLPIWSLPIITTVQICSQWRQLSGS